MFLQSMAQVSQEAWGACGGLKLGAELCWMRPGLAQEHRDFWAFPPPALLFLSLNIFECEML